MAEQANAAETNQTANTEAEGTTLLTDSTTETESTSTPPVTEGATAETTDETKAAEGEGDKPDDKAAEGPPEKYEFTAPEGVQLDETALAAFEPVAREMGLTQEQANKLVELQAGIVQRQAEAHAAQREAWKTEVKSDKEIGGDQYAPSVKAAQIALSKFGTPELRAALDASGLGNHPEVVRVFARIGKASADGKVLKGDPPMNQKSQAEVMFGDTTPKT